MNNTPTSYLALFAASAYFYNDVLALVSVVGCILWFIGAFPNTHRLYTALGEWSLAPLVFGAFFQLSFIAVGMGPETDRMGVLAPMPPGLVSGLFLASFLLLAGRGWVKRKYKSDLTGFGNPPGPSR